MIPFDISLYFSFFSFSSLYISMASSRIMIVYTYL